MPIRRRPPGSRADQDLEDRILTSLYSTHAGAVRRFVAGYVADLQHRDDIVQETFVRAWQNVGRIDTVNGNPRSFLFTIAHNIVVDHWRAASRRGEILAEVEVIAPTTEAVNKSIERILIGESLQRLSAEHREVVKALYLDDLTVREAAERLNLAVGTVKSRSYYALRALRSAFDEMGLL
jgi:RNA polymerase sigma-70 factor (ECF subfamily)